MSSRRGKAGTVGTGASLVAQMLHEQMWAMLEFL